MEVFQRTNHWASKLKVWLSDHVFFLLAVVAAYLILFHVSQVTHLWQQLPFGTSQWVGFLTLLVGMGYLYGTSLAAFWRPGLTNRDWDQSNSLERGFWAPARFVLGWLNASVRSTQPISQGPLGYAVPLALIGIGLSGLFMPVEHWTGLWFLGEGFLRMASLWMFALGVWLLIGIALGAERVTAREESTADADPPSKASRRTIWQTCGQVLAWYAVTVSAGELLWITGVSEIPGASLRLYSIWALAHVTASLLLTAALVDYLERETLYPIRLAFVGTLVVLFLLAGPERIEDPLPPGSVVVANGNHPQPQVTNAALASADGGVAPTPQDHQWYQAVEARLDAMKPGPIVLVAASGGGSRAAAFTALVLRMLANEPFDLPDLENEARQVDHGTWADHVLLVSAVSGGSLATARYVQKSGAESWREDESIDHLRYTDTYELHQRTGRQLRHWYGEAQQRLNDPDAKDEAQWLERAIEPFDKQSANGVSTAAAPYMSSLFDEMCLDFMAPILRGYLVPGSTRGQGLIDFWDDHFDWRNRSQASLARDGFWNPEVQPLMFLNTCDIDHGRRVVVGFPQLPSGLLASSYADSSGEQGREYDAIAISELLPATSGDVLLSRAVRLSSNFPFGFPVSVLPGVVTEEGEEREQPVHLLDGGVIDNTGIDSLHSLFVGLHRGARKQPMGPAAKLLDRLRRRGVVFLVIDSGAKPATASAGPFRAISQPYDGLNASAYSNSLRVGDRFLGDLREILSDSARSRLLRRILESPNTAGSAESARITAVLDPPRQEADPLSVLTYQLTCNHISGDDAHVMTAFALGPADKATVVAQFLVQRERWRDNTDGFREYFEGVHQAIGRGADDEHIRYSLAAELLNRSDAILQDLAKDGDSRGDETDDSAVRSVQSILAAVRQLVPQNSEAFQQKGSQYLALLKILNEADSPEISGALVADARSKGGGNLSRREAITRMSSERNPREIANQFGKAIQEVQELAASATGSPSQQNDREAASRASQLQRNLTRQSHRQATFYGKGE